MKYKKLISFISLTAVFAQNIPTSLISYASEINKIEQQQEEVKHDSNKNVETTKTEENKDEPVEKDKASIEENVFNVYSDEDNELAFSLGFDSKEGKFTIKNRSDKELSKKNSDIIVYKINLYDKDGKEKLAIDIFGKDTGNSEKLDVLNDTKYEIGDFIKITPLNPKDGLKILGDIKGDVDINKEDYSDGIDNDDYIYNVRFEITEEGLKSVYNEAPVIHGLSNIENVKDQNIDPLAGISVTDDHDITIDNSKILIEIEEKTDSYAILKYTVEDSWGRSTSGTRKFSSIENSDTFKSSNSSKNITTRANEITQNIITVEGVPYAGNIKERFKIKFDPISKEIKIYDDDGRMMSTSVKGEYFKFELYDKNMELKTSVTLLGTDKSDSEKLDTINNYLFEEGDYIGIWHAESDTNLKIGGNVKQTIKSNGQAIPTNKTVSYANGLPKKEISERRFRIKESGLEEVNNEAPVIQDLNDISISRGEEVDLLKDVKVIDDFDKFDANSLENEYVSIKSSAFDNSKVGTHTVTYTATDKWGKSSTKDRRVTVKSDNQLDYTYIEFMKNESERLFKINIDPVKQEFFVDGIENTPDTPIAPDKASSIFKLKVYTKNGILQKTLNIKGTDKLKTVLKRINGYKYNLNDRIELWSSTPKNIRIHGTLTGNNGTNKENYEDGIDNVDYMKNVRFEIGATELKYIYNEAPKLTVSTELTTYRNGTVNLDEGITASDDHDNDITKKITHGDIDTSTIGEKYVEYKVVDSWGRSTLIKRKVTIYPRSNLEYNYITIKNNETEEPILSIRFDDVAKKFKINKLDLSKVPSSLNNNDKVFELKLIKTGSTTKTNNLETITFTKQDLNNNDKLAKLNDLSYEYGDYISLWSYDSSGGILLSAKSHILLNGFDSDDQMFNSRFKIKNEGLEMTYNEAPKFYTDSLNSKLYLYKGERLTEDKARQGIIVKDDIDGTINVSRIKVKNIDEINTKTNTIGEYSIEYEVTDSWGRSTHGERILSVISKSVSNDIEFYDTNGTSKLFSLKYNPIKNRFDFIKNTDMSKINSDESTPTTPVDDSEFKLAIFNTKGEEVGKLELSENEITNFNKVNKLENISVYDDYYFSVWSKTPSRIKIKGYMTGNNRLGENENENEDYSTGISNPDYMNNVRFKLTTDGLEAVYNKAPKIMINSESTLTEFAGNQIDYTKDVTVLDDHDKTISKENVKVNVVEENNEEKSLKIGNNTVKLSVKDSWGREGTVNRNIKIENGISKNNIVVFNNPNLSNDSKVLEIGFNPSNNKLKLIRYSRTFGSGREQNYFRISIKRPNNEGQGTTDIVPQISFNMNENAKTVSSKFIPLENYQLNYGDIIEIYHGHPSRFSIDGKVTDSRENYRDGVQNPENILNTKFEITRSGLKAIYTNPDKDKVTENKNIIGPMAPEKFPFKLQVVPSERKFKIIDKTATQILSNKDNVVYKLVLIGQNGKIKKISNFKENMWGNNSSEINSWDNQPFEYGDCIYIWHRDPHRSIIKGEIKGAREDYSNGVDDIDNMNNVIFKLTADGLESVYNKAPEIKGVEDKDVYKGETFNASAGVTYTDDYDQNKLNISITGDVKDDNTVDTSTLGVKTVTYTATDRWGKTTTVSRKITVRPNLYKNIFKVFADKNSSVSEHPKSNNDSRIPVFEIGFDSVTNKYRVFNQTNDRLLDGSQETVFKLEIKDSSGNIKKEITLVGNDRGISPKIDELNKVSYAYGDIIRIERSDLDGISIVGTVTGHIPTKEDMATETNKHDYMNNTGYEVSEQGLKAIYNHAPILEGVQKSKTITKGTTLNLTEGLVVSDDIDSNISVENNVYVRVNGEDISEPKRSNYTFDKLGTYKIEYIVSDSWKRYTLKEVTITVESKVKENSIEVYGPGQNLAFRVTFDTNQNKFVLIGNESPNTYISSSDENKYFEMIVRDIKGKEKYKVTLTGDSARDREELAKINDKEFSIYDTISLYGKTPEAVKIKGSVKSGVRAGYTNGFGTIDKYSKVRFKITDDGLKEITKKDPIISATNKTSIKGITIKRGDDIDFLNGIVVDVQDDNNEDYEIEVQKGNFNKLKEGIYTITYIVTNSWGSKVEKTRDITVEPRTDLEKVKLNLKNNSNENILTIGFDSIERKLRVLEYTLNATIDSNNRKMAFGLNAYDSLGNTLGTIELNGNQSITQDLVDRINAFNYIEGYMLSIWAKNPSTHLSLEGNVKDAGENYANGVDNIDKMENGRFEILSDGVKYIYNNKPIITGGDTTIEYYKGTLLSIPSDIAVSDDHDIISKNDVIIDDDQVDYDELGEYPITYIVEDSWGRTGKKEGKINIESAMDSNSIDVYPLITAKQQSSIKAFSIKFIREGNKNKIKIEEKSSTQFNASKPSEIFMKIKIYGLNGEEKKSVDLLGSDAGNSDKLNSINNYVYTRGEYIAIEGITESTKAHVKISGTVVNQKEDYSNGVDKIDNIQNVRFMFTDLGLESVYNEAPKIIIDNTIKLDAIKGDDIPYMRGVNLKDDHDKLTKDNVEVTWNPSSRNIKNNPIVGENILQYKVTDSWGRSSYDTRSINLTNGILDNEILFGGFNNNVETTEALKIKFKATDDNKVQLNLSAKGNKFLTADEPNYYKIEICKPDGTLLYKESFNGYKNGNDVITSLQNAIRDLKIDYDSTIKLHGGHPDRLKIKGPIRDKREDYSDGVQNPENYSSVKFKVTDSGLKSIYTEEDEINDNENIIALVARESLPIKFKIDPVTKKINVYKTTTTSLQWELGGNIEVFRMYLTSNDGVQKASVVGDSRDRGDAQKFKDAFNDKSFEYGDYLTIWHKTPKRVIIKGNVRNAREDYSNGVDNSDNLTEAVFKLTENGIEAAYKTAPKITGMKDARIEKGKTFNIRDVAGEVRATDEIDGPITNRITYTENVNTNKVGIYEVIYKVTNSNNRTARRSSTVIVYARPKIQANSNSIIELNSIVGLYGEENKDEAIREHLKKAVTVTDEEDDANGKTVKLEILSHNVNPNKEGTYEAKYRATDSDGDVTEKTVPIQVIRTINVSVPTTIPFQVVTNLKNKEADPFISGVIKISNNNTSDVQVSVKSFTKKQGSGDLEIVDPNTLDWENLSYEESMSKISLGLYNKSGLNVETGVNLSKANPLWLTEGIAETKIGTLSKAESLSTPYESKLSFTSKHGKRFKGGTYKGKFDLIFKFE